MNRYQRQIQLDQIGPEGQQRLAEASVLVIGAGGLGCPVLQYLAAAGVGKLGIADADTVALTNLHRQILYGERDLEQPKTRAAARRIIEMNDEVELAMHSNGIHAANALVLVDKYDLIIDGTDNFETRYLVNDACVRGGKPWIYGALFKNQGQFALFNANGGPTYRCVYPDPPKAGEVPNCEQMGILGTVSGLIGTHMAHLALQYLLWPGDAPNNKVFYWNLKSYAFKSLTVSRNEAAVSAIQNSAQPLERVVLAGTCPTNSLIISLEQGLKLEQAQWIDIRRPDEEPVIEFEGLKKIPQNMLIWHLQHLDASQAYVLFCKSGARAKKAALSLKDKGFKEVHALEANIEDIIEAFEPKESNNETN